MIPATAERVPVQTASHINEEICRKTEENIERAVNGGPDAINDRLAELELEWDIERTLEANAATVSLIGLGLSVFIDRRFFLLPVAVSGFLLQHAIQGWCPPLPVFRRLGVRTQREIDDERNTLKALRGDFREISRTDGAQALAKVMK